MNPVQKSLLKQFCAWLFETLQDVSSEHRDESKFKEFPEHRDESTRVRKVITNIETDQNSRKVIAKVKIGKKKGHED